MTVPANQFALAFGFRFVTSAVWQMIDTHTRVSQIPKHMDVDLARA